MVVGSEASLFVEEKKKSVDTRQSREGQHIKPRKNEIVSFTTTLQPHAFFEKISLIFDENVRQHFRGMCESRTSVTIHVHASIRTSQSHSQKRSSVSQNG